MQLPLCVHHELALSVLQAANQTCGVDLGKLNEVSGLPSGTVPLLSRSVRISLS